MSMQFLFFNFIQFLFLLFSWSGRGTLGSARGALRAPRSTGWEPLLYMNTLVHLW